MSLNAGEGEKKPRIAVFRQLLFTPTEIFIYNQLAAVSGFAFVFVGQKLVSAPPAGYDVLVLDGGLKNRLAARWHSLSRAPGKLLSLLAGQKISLVHAQFGTDGVYALKLARALKVPLVTTFRGFDATLSTGALLRSGYVSWINYRLFRGELARKGDLFLCVSDFLRRKVIRLGFPPERTIVHYNGVDTRAIRPASHPRQNLVVHAARLVEKKGTSYLLRAFALVAAKDDGARLLVIGDGPLRAPLAKEANDLGLKERVSFLGHVAHPSVLEWMAKASAVAIPSVTARSGNSEGLPNVLLEAAALGVPAVATNHAGIPEALEDGRTGFLVPERSVAELSDRLLYLLRNQSARDEMGKAARALAERFDLALQTRRLEAIYRGLIRE